VAAPVLGRRIGKWQALESPGFPRRFIAGALTGLNHCPASFYLCVTCPSVRPRSHRLKLPDHGVFSLSAIRNGGAGWEEVAFLNRSGAPTGRHEHSARACYDTRTELAALPA
jgi:hypothetical protein